MSSLITHSLFSYSKHSTESMGWQQTLTIQRDLVQAALAEKEVLLPQNVVLLALELTLGEVLEDQPPSTESMDSSQHLKESLTMES